jgi:hypothetical protein
VKLDNIVFSPGLFKIRVLNFDQVNLKKKKIKMISF